MCAHRDSAFGSNPHPLNRKCFLSQLVSDSELRQDEQNPVELVTGRRGAGARADAELVCDRCLASGYEV